MDIEYANSETPTPAKRHWPWATILFVAALVAYAVFLLTRFAPAINEPDANGYWAQATLMVQQGHTWLRAESDAQYIGMHWLLKPDGDYVSRYPPGLSGVIGVVYMIFGYKASVLVNPMLALIALAGMFVATRYLLGKWWGLLAVVLLALNPTFTYHALANDSHMAVAAVLIWGIYLLLRWSREGLLWQIALAGAVLGCIPTIRYPDAIMGIAVGVFVLMHWRKPRFPLHLLAALLGAAIAIVPLLVRNQRVLGAFWKTGYSLSREQTGFSWQWFTQHWETYIQSLNGEGLGLLCALGIVGITLMVGLRRWRAIGVMLALMVAPMLVLYMAYYWGGGGMSLRFLVPIMPLLILAGIWLMDEMTQAAPTAGRVAVPLVVLLLQLGWGATATWARATQQEYSKQVLVAVADGLVEATHEGDVIVANNQLAQHLDFVRKWKIADLSLVRGGMGGPGGGPMGGGMRGNRMGGPGMMPGGPNDGEDMPSPMQPEKQQHMRKLYDVANPQAKFVNDVEKWAAGAGLWLVGSEADVKQQASSLAAGSTVEIVKRVQLPKQPVQTMNPGGPGNFGGGRQRGGFGGPGIGGPGMGGPGMGGPGFGGPGQAGPGGGNFGGRQRGGMGGPGGGGPMGSPFIGESEVVIARWIPPEAPTSAGDAN